jgi:hypothetical protein
MYSTPMDNIQAQFDEHNKPDDHLAKYVSLSKGDFYEKHFILERVVFPHEQLQVKNYLFMLELSIYCNHINSVKNLNIHSNLLLPMG